MYLSPIFLQQEAWHLVTCYFVRCSVFLAFGYFTRRVSLSSGKWLVQAPSLLSLGRDMCPETGLTSLLHPGGAHQPTAVPPGRCPSVGGHLPKPVMVLILWPLLLSSSWLPQRIHWAGLEPWGWQCPTEGRGTAFLGPEPQWQNLVLLSSSQPHPPAGSPQWPACPAGGTGGSSPRGRCSRPVCSAGPPGLGT